MTSLPRRRPISGATKADPAESGFTLIELMMAMVVMAVVMASLTTVLVNSLVAADYNRQRTEGQNLANQAIEELRALSWTTLQEGMSSTDLAGDQNVAIVTGGACFQGESLDIAGNVVVDSSCSTPNPWTDPACLKSAVSTLPTAGTLASPAPLRPHEQCYRVGGFVYAVDVYLTAGPALSVPGPAAPPLTATVVVTWANPVRGNQPSDHIVTTTQLSSCLTVGTKCN